MKIGIFDSGYGGLTILKEIRRQLPEYEYLYLGDNARAPYGTRSFDVIYQYTWQCVHYLFEQGCQLVILACNTASAKALRSIQQRDLLAYDPSRRVLGVIRPTVEVVGDLTQTRHIGLLGTPGTINSGSYPIELQKLSPDVQVTSLACPMWVPLIENGEYDKPGADYFVRQYLEQLLQQDPEIDTIILGCTHYPLLLSKIEKALQDLRPTGAPIRLLAQGELVALSLKDYLQRHPEIESLCEKGSGSCRYLTTENAQSFAKLAKDFIGEDIQAEHISLQ